VHFHEGGDAGGECFAVALAVAAGDFAPELDGGLIAVEGYLFYVSA
jgi:hypothetical protein